MFISDKEKQNQTLFIPRWIRPVELPDDLQQQLPDVGVSDPCVAPQLITVLLINSPDEARAEVGRALAKHFMPQLPDEHPIFR